MGWIQTQDEFGSALVVAVFEDIDDPHCIGAYWGELNTTIHKGFGVSGAVTNGVVRDLGDLPEGFPAIAGLIGPGHGTGNAWGSKATTIMA